MMDKLLKSNLPKIIVKTIGYMLKNTFADFHFNDGKGAKWKIIKGSRQEGTISQLLFKSYI